MLAPNELSPFPSFTKTWHNESYDAISPIVRPELSVAGKHVVITGGGTGIGKAVAIGFAEAKASSISILGRRLDRLEAAKAELLARVPDAKVFLYSADLVDSTSTKAAFDQIAKQVGKIDIYVSNAGVYADGPTATTNVDDFMLPFEANVRGALIAFQAFLPHAAPGAYLLFTSTVSAHMSPMFPQASYAASKLANVKLVEAIAIEHPELHVVQIHPGVVITEMQDKFTMDAENLPGHFYVWLCSQEAKFLKNKFVWANWDVEECKARAEEIRSSNLLTIGLRGVDM